MKFFIYNTDTCARVKLFGEDVRYLCQENGAEELDEKGITDADYVFVNTCSFLETKSDYFLSFLRQLAEKINPEKIVIVGCLGKTHEKDVKEISSDIKIYARDVAEIAAGFGWKKLPKTVATDLSENLPPDKAFLAFLNKHCLKSKHIDFRLKKDKVCYIQISQGCQGRCTYCSEKFITHLKSRTKEEVLEAVFDGINRGFELFSLSSDDASAYGKDIGTNLDELLEELVKIKDDIYFIIPEFNPQGITEKTIELLGDKKFLYITIPVQSGSQRILDFMLRPYQISQVKAKVRLIKYNNPDIMINTHIIVGFPSETDEDFDKTYKLLKSGIFDRVKVFVYSDRPNTKASKVRDEYKISSSVKEKRRKKALHAITLANLKKHSLVNLILNLDQIK